MTKNSVSVARFIPKTMRPTCFAVGDFAACSRCAWLNGSVATFINTENGDARG